MKKVFLVPVAAVMLAACGGDPEPAAESPASEAAEEKETTGEAPDEASDGSDAPVDEEPAEEAGKTVPMGEEVAWEANDGRTLNVAMTEADCSVDKIDGVDYENTDADFNPGAAEPEDGKLFCVIRFDITNTGTEPVPVEMPGDVKVSDGKTYGPSEDDLLWSGSMMVEAGTENFLEANPDETIPYIHVVSVPEGTEFEAVMWPDYPDLFGPEITFTK